MTSTLAGLLAGLPDPSQPLITYYDEAAPERVELSGTTTANWVAKTANMLTEGFDAEAGMTIRIETPSHWETFVWLLASWSVGLVVTDGPADIAVLGPELDAAGDEELRFALSLRPMGLRFAEPPPGCVDYNAEVLGFGDVFVDLDPPVPSSPAVDLGGVARTHAELLAATPGDGARRLITPGTLTRDISLLVGAATGGGSIVLATHAAEERLATIAREERTA